MSPLGPDGRSYSDLDYTDYDAPGAGASVEPWWEPLVALAVGLIVVYLLPVICGLYALAWAIALLYTWLSSSVSLAQPEA
jgi:hypothetical protein